MLLLRRRHHVVRVRNDRLCGVLARMVVSRGQARGSLREGVACWGGRTGGVVLYGHGDEVAVLTCGHCGNAEGLLRKSTRGSGQVRRRGGEGGGGGGRLPVGLVALERRWDQRVGLGQVWGWRQAEAVRRVGLRRVRGLASGA